MRSGRLGSARAARQRLEEAVTAFREALKERTRERVPLDWAATQTNLGNALSALGERESGTARLEEAVARLSARRCRNSPASAARWTGHDPEQPRHRAFDAGRAGERHGAAGRGGHRLSAPRSRNEPASASRCNWAATQNNLGTALAGLGARTGDPVKLAEARKAVDAAFEVFMQAGQEQYRSYFENRLSELDRQIAELNPPR